MSALEPFELLTRRLAKRILGTEIPPLEIGPPWYLSPEPRAERSAGTADTNAVSQRLVSAR